MDLRQLWFRLGIAAGYALEFAGLKKSKKKRALAYLRSSKHPVAPALIRALNNRYNSKPSTSDSDLFSRLESLRKTLLASHQVINRLDYGSGHAFDSIAAPRTQTISVSRLCRVAGTPASQARLLYYLVKELKPVHCLELGTCLGISAAYQLSALPEGGKFITMEGDPETAKLATENLRSIGLTDFEVKSGPFAAILPGLLQSPYQVDYVLIDGHHDGDAMRQYFTLIRPRLSPNACVIFDDIDWSPGMQKAWRELQQENVFELAVDLGRVGIAVV
jgi:predicted O-methyltransferase YrrM